MYLLSISLLNEWKKRIMRLRFLFGEVFVYSSDELFKFSHSHENVYMGKCTRRIFLNYSQVQKEQRVKMAGPCIFFPSHSNALSLALALSLCIYILFPLQLKIRGKRKSGCKILENILWWRPIVFQHVVTYNCMAVAIGSSFLWMTANMLW